MAYMPQPKGVVKEDNDFKLDKRAEKKTVADLPDKLAAGDDDAGIKVMINGKPKSEPQTKAPAKARSAAPMAESAPHTMHDPKSSEPTDATHDDHMPSVAPRKRSGKGAILIAVVLLIVSAALGYLYYASRTQVSKLNADLQQANSDKESLQARLQTSTTTEPTSSSLVGDSAGKRSIPELGLTYKLTSDTGKVTYAYVETSDASAVAHSAVYFSSTTLIAAERKVVKDNTFGCRAENGPLGMLTAYKANETIPDSVGKGKFADLKVDNKTTYKIGDTYYVYMLPEAPCSTKGDVSTTQTADRALVTELLKTLAAQ